MRSLFTALIALALLAPVAVRAWLQNPPVADGKVHIRYIAWGTPEQLDTERHIIEAFERTRPDIQVEILVAPVTQYPTKLQIMLAGRTEPDVFRADLNQMPKYAALGYLASLNDLIANDPHFSLSDFVPQAVDEMTIGGKILGLNTLFGGRIIYYNKTLFAAAGLPDPYQLYLQGKWDYPAFLEAATKLSLSDPRTGVCTQFGVVTDPSDLWLFIWGFGGTIVAQDGTIRVDEPAGVAGLRFYSDLARKYHAMPLPSQGALGAYTFESGNVGMVTGFAGESPRYRRIPQTPRYAGDVAFEWDIVPFPTGPAGRVYLLKGNGLVMSTHTRHPEASWALIKYMTGPDAERTYCGDSLRRAIPTRKAIIAGPEFRDATREPYNVGTLLELYHSSRRLPFNAVWQDWQPAYLQWVDRLMSEDPRDHATPEQTAAGIRRAIEKANREAWVQPKAAQE